MEILDENITAQFCAFCGSSHIIKTEVAAGNVPESLIPFVISKDKAEEFFSNWIKKLFFAPRALKTSYNMNKMNGIYIPFCTYDSETFSDYTAERGTFGEVDGESPVSIIKVMLLILPINLRTSSF